MRATRGLIVGFFVVEAPTSSGGWLTQISLGFRVWVVELQ